MFSLHFSSSGICVCGSTIFWEQPVATVLFNWESVSSDFRRMFLIWRAAGFLDSGWRGWCFLCLLLFLACVWVMVLGKHPLMDVFWFKFRELNFESLFNLMWSRIFGSCAARVVFSLPVVFSAICVYGSIVSSIHCHVDMVVACDHVDRRFPLRRLCSQWTVGMRTT